MKIYYIEQFVSVRLFLKSLTDNEINEKIYTIQNMLNEWTKIGITFTGNIIHDHVIHE